MPRLTRALVAGGVVAATLTLTAPPAAACTGAVCDTVNAVCEIVRGAPCVR